MERGRNKVTILGWRFWFCKGARRAFSGAKKPTSNEERGKIRPPKLLLYFDRVPMECPQLSNSDLYEKSMLFPALPGCRISLRQ